MAFRATPPAVKVRDGTRDNTAAAFASPEPPYLRYLNLLGVRGGVEVAESADTLRKDLDECKRLCDQEHGVTDASRGPQLLAQYLAQYKEPVAQIIDLRAASSSVDVHESGAFSAEVNASIDETLQAFISKIHECANDVHTRLILLRDPNDQYPLGNSKETHAMPEATIRSRMLAWKLLCLHLLGVELEIRPHDTTQLLSRPQHGATSFVNQPSMLHFGVRASRDLRISSSKYVGQRLMGSASPYLGQ